MAIFVKEDGKSPVRFMLHHTIQKQGSIDKLSSNIKRNGGQVVKTDDDADVVLMHERAGWSLQEFRNAYNTHPDQRKRQIYVEEMRFIQTCLDRNKYYHFTAAKKKMSGRPTGGGRTAFTIQDEDNMCQYLATTVPQKENGGRLGQNLWKEMVRNFHLLPEPYYWAQNHSWQSWREHYKRNQTRLDPIISRYVLKVKPTAKSTFGYSRAVNRYHGLKQEEEEEEEEDRNAAADAEEEEYLAGLSDYEEQDEHQEIGLKDELKQEDAPQDEFEQDHFEQGAGEQEPNIEEAQQEFERDWHQNEVPVDHWGQDNGAENEGVEESDGSLFADNEESAPEEPAPLTSQVTLINPTQVKRQSLPAQSKPFVVQSSPGPSLVKPAISAPAPRRDIFISSPVSRPASSPPPTNYPVLLSAPRRAARRRSADESSPDSDSDSSESRETSFSPRVSSPTRPRRSLAPEPSPSPRAPFRNTRARSRSTALSSPIDPPRKTNKGKGKALPSVAESIGGAETAMDEEWVEGVLIGDHVEEESMVDTVPNVDEEALLDTEPESLVPAQRKRRLSTDDESTLAMVRRVMSNSDIQVIRPDIPKNKRARFPAVTVASGRPPRSPVTPSRMSPRKQQSVTSEDRFPLPGTQASAVKKNLLRNGKTTPYTPPHGTRAAAYAEGNI